MKFTPEEHKTIKAGWRALTDYADTRGRMGESRELHGILVSAQKELCDLVDAKGLLLSMFVEALDDDKPDIAQIWQWPPYTREIKAYAWHTARRDGPSDDEWAPMAKAAAEARKARIAAKARNSGLVAREWSEVTA